LAVIVLSACVRTSLNFVPITDVACELSFKLIKVAVSVWVHACGIIVLRGISPPERKPDILVLVNETPRRGIIIALRLRAQ
jgi:hypothetical protein